MNPAAAVSNSKLPQLDRGTPAPSLRVVAARTLAAMLIVVMASACRPQTATTPAASDSAPSDSDATTADGNSNSPHEERSGGSASSLQNSDQPSASLPWPLVELPIQNGEIVYRSGREAQLRTILESLGGGVGVLDYDRDGAADLWFPQGGSLVDEQVSGFASRLLKRLADDTTRDVSSHANLSGALNYSHGVAINDFDSDGFADVLVTGYGGLQLWHNQGDGSFSLIPAEVSGLGDQAWSTSAAWGDFNGDAHPDLYVAHYVDWSFANHPRCVAAHDSSQREICPPRVFQPLRDVLYLNQGDGTFSDATDAWQLPSDGMGLGVLVADLNGDDALDVYVANDTTPNFLLFNQASQKFLEDGNLSGVALDDRGIPNGSMGVATADIDGNGRLDLWVANYQAESSALYRQVAPGSFVYSSPLYGLKTIDPIYVGFGTVLHDFDRDGDSDVVVSNGHVLDFPAQTTRNQRSLTLALEGRRLSPLSWPDDHPLNQLWAGRGLALWDAEGDGDADLVFTPSDQAAWGLRNTGTGGRCFTIEPIGVQSARIPIGAQLTVKTDRATRLEPLVSGGSYLSSQAPCFFVIIPDGETLQELTIRWPSGNEQTFAVTPDTTHAVLIENDPTIQTLPSR